MMFRPLLRWARRGAIYLVALLVLAAAILFTLDFSAYRRPLAARLSEVLQREVTIAGPLHVSPALLPTLSAEQVSIRNSPWGDAPHLAEAERVAVRIRLLALLRGKLEIDLVRLEGAAVYLETSAEGEHNWLLTRRVEGAARPAPDLSALPVLQVESSTVSYRSAVSGVALTLSVTEAEIAAPGGGALTAAFTGAFRDVPISIAATAGPLTELVQGTAPWPITLAASAAGTRFSAQGTLIRQPETHFDVKAVAAGDDMHAVESLLGIRLPPLGPFNLQAHLVRDDTGYRADTVSGYLGPPESGWRFTVREGTVAAPARDDTHIALSGTFRAQPFTFTLQGGPYPQLIVGGETWPVTSRLTAADSKLSLQGTLTPAERAFAIRVAADGRDLRALEPLVGHALPPLGTYALGGQLRGKGQTLSLQDGFARAGDTDARATVTVDFAQARPLLRGRIAAGRLSAPDLQAILAVLTQPAASGGDARHWHERRLPLDPLRGIDTDVLVTVDEVLGAGRQVAEVATNLRVTADAVAAESVHVRLGGATLRGRIAYRQDGNTLQGTLEAHSREIDHGPLLAALGITDRLAGHARELDFSLTGRGASLGDIWQRGRMELKAREGTLIVIDPRTAGRTEIGISSAVATHQRDAGLTLRGSGSYRGQPFTLALTGGALAALTDNEESWAVQAEGTIAGARVEVEGKARAVFRGDGADLRVAVSGERLDTLNDLLGIQLPAAGPYFLRTHLATGGSALRLTELEAGVGQSDIAGHIHVTRDNGKTHVVSQLTAEVLRAVDLQGVAPKPQATPASAPEPGPEATVAKRLFPDISIPTHGLDNITLDLNLRARRVAAAKSFFSNLRLAATIRAGALDLTPIAADAWGGRFDSWLRLDLSGDKPAAELSLALHGISYEKVTKPMASLSISGGTADAALRLRGSGDTLRAMLSDAEGAMEFFGSEGVVHKRFLNLWASDLIVAMLPDMSEKDGSPLRCMVGHFDVADGVASTKSLLLDLERVVVKGNGTINLGTERVDLLLWPEPRDWSLVSVSTPVLLQGPLSQPTIALQTRGVLEDVAWFLISANNPLALLVGLVKPSAVARNQCVTSIGESPTGTPVESTPPNIMSKTGDFFRGLGNLITRPFRKDEPTASPPADTPRSEGAVLSPPAEDAPTTQGTAPGAAAPPQPGGESTIPPSPSE